MRNLILAACAAVTLAAPAIGALPKGASAPAFTAQGALGGKQLSFSLLTALRKGPVVLYFFPAAFTAGCTIEAHKFAEATDTFNRLGATVVGVTAGNVERVADFSKQECRDKFAVLADPGAKIAAQYQTLLKRPGAPLSDRTSYVIAPNGTIALSYTDGNPEHHVENALAAVRALRAKRS